MTKRIKNSDREQALKSSVRLHVTDSLVNRLSYLNLLILTITMMLTFAIIASASLVSARERQISSAQLSAQTLGNSIAPMLVFDDSSAARMELLSFSQRSDLLEVKVITPNGKIFSSWQATRPSHYNSTFSSFSNRVTSLTGSLFSREIKVQMPIKFKNELIGQLILRESLDGLWSLAFPYF